MGFVLLQVLSGADQEEVLVYLRPYFSFELKVLSVVLAFLVMIVLMLQLDLLPLIASFV